jgi:hypothetical protein
MARQGGYQVVSANLRVKEVKISATERFVVCHKPDAADRDGAVRANLIERLEATIAGTDWLSPTSRTEVRGVISIKPGVEPIPARHTGRAAAVDAAKVAAEAPGRKGSSSPIVNDRATAADQRSDHDRTDRRMNGTQRGEGRFRGKDDDRCSPRVRRATLWDPAERAQHRSWCVEDLPTQGMPMTSRRSGHDGQRFRWQTCASWSMRSRGNGCSARVGVVVTPGRSFQCSVETARGGRPIARGPI